MHPDELHVDSASFSAKDVRAWKDYLPHGNMYLATLDCEIYVYDSVSGSRAGVYVCAYSPRAISGAYVPYKKPYECLC